MPVQMQSGTVRFSACPVACALFPVAPQHGAGLVDVSVLVPNIFPVTLADAFTYVPGQWGISRIDVRPRKEQTA